MRIIFLGISALFYTTCFSQTPNIAFDTARAMLERSEVSQALPYFETVMGKGDEALKRTTINYLTEQWVNGRSLIAVSKSANSYGNLLANYMSATFKGKESTMNAADHYTAGLVFYALAYSGALGELRKAIYQLDAAAKGGHTDALYYLARVGELMKNQEPSIQWEEIIDLYTRASVAKKTPQPLIEFGNSKLDDLRWKYKKAADLDTSLNIFFVCLRNVMKALPDSFHVAVNSFWEKSFSFSREGQDTSTSNPIKIYFAYVTVPSNSSARKGLAWHRLYEYFYDNTSKNDTVRGKIMSELKSYYNNDRELLADIADFINTATPNDAGFALSINSKWLTFFSPMQVSNPESFFRAAAKTEQNYLAFLEKNAPASRFTSPIAQGYRERFNILYNLISNKKVGAKNRYTLGDGSLTNMRLIDKLSALPDIRNSSAIKYVYADMAVLNNLNSIVGSGAIPAGFNELPNVYGNWSAADKKGYDTQHINLLLKTVQELAIFLNQNESEKVQKTIKQVLTLIKTN